MRQQRRSHAEGHDVRPANPARRPKGDCRAAHACHAAIQRIEQAGQQDEQDGVMVVRVIIEMPPIKDLQRGDVATQNVPCRHQRGQNGNAEVHGQTSSRKCKRCHRLRKREVQSLHTAPSALPSAA